MERWMISEIWRELKQVAHELGSLVMTLLPWLPVFGLATWGVARFGWQAAPVIVLLAPWYRWLLRGGRPPVRRVRDLPRWLMLAGLATAGLYYFSGDIPVWIPGLGLPILALLIGAQMK